MELLNRFRIPAIIAVSVIVAVIVVYAAWIAPEGHKLSGLHVKQAQLQSQQAELQAEIVTLRHDKAQMVNNCEQLSDDLTEIPATPSVDSFLQQVTQLAIASGDPNTPSISVTNAPATTRGAAGVTPVAVGLTLTGDYGQVRAFIHGLDEFPRLFSVTTIAVSGGPIAGQGINAASPGPYNLSLQGDVFFTTEHNDVCPGTVGA